MVSGTFTDFLFGAFVYVIVDAPVTTTVCPDTVTADPIAGAEDPDFFFASSLIVAILDSADVSLLSTDAGTSFFCSAVNEL